MSPYIGKRIRLRDAMGEWWDGLLEDVVEEAGRLRYVLRLDDGYVLKIPVDDESGILDRRIPETRGSCRVIPIKKKQAR
jgi:hypothetical protein